MKHSRRLEIFENVRAEYAGFLESVLWRLTADKELFAEALQYALLQMWRHVEKLNGKKAGAYIYRVALSAASKAWRNRVGRDGVPLRLIKVRSPDMVANGLTGLEDQNRFRVLYNITPTAEEGDFLAPVNVGLEDLNYFREDFYAGLPAASICP